MKKFPSYLKKFCASAPASFTGPPGVPTQARARFDSRAGAFGWNQARAFLCLRACRPSGWPLLAVLCGCGLLPCRCDRLFPALCAVGFLLLPVACYMPPGWPAVWAAVSPACVGAGCGCRVAPCLGGYRGRIYQATRRLYRARKTPPCAAVRLPGGLFSLPPFADVAGQSRPASVGRRFFRPPVYLPGGPRCFLGACLASSGLPELPRRTERPTENATKISSVFPGEVFSAHGQSLVSWYINAPPIVPPRLAEINWKLVYLHKKVPRKKFSGHFPPKGGNLAQ